MFKHHPTLKFIWDRGIWYVLTFLVAITINFFLPRFGSDPIELIMSKQKGLNSEQAREKKASYMREFGLVEVLTTATTEDGGMLMAPDGSPVTFEQLKAKNLLTVNERKTFWISGVTVTDPLALKLSLLKIIANGKKINGFDPTDSSVINPETFAESIKDALTLDEIKSLAGITFKTNSKLVYSLKADELSKAFGGPVTMVNGEEANVVKQNGALKFFDNGDENVAPALIKQGTAIDSQAVNITVKEQVQYALEKTSKGVTLSPIRSPLVKQYLLYMMMTLRGDLGTSFVKYPEKVNTLVMQTLGWSIGLQLPSIVIGWFIGNLLGALAAYKRGLFDKVLFPVALFLNSFPFFAFGMILIYVFAGILPIFPSSGGYANDVVPGFTVAFILSVAYCYVLPFMSIFPIFASGQATGMRTMGIYELGTSYVKYAKTLGIKENKILMYIFRNAVLPQLTGLALMLGSMIGGALITEMIFSYPGLGMALLTATTNNDYPMIQGSSLLICITVLIANFSVDVLIGFFDPRVKAGMSGV